MSMDPKTRHCPRPLLPQTSAFSPLHSDQGSHRLRVDMVRQILNQLNVSVSGASSPARDAAPVGAGDWKYTRVTTGMTDRAAGHRPLGGALYTRSNEASRQ